MSKPTILFKAPAVSVYRQPAKQDGTPAASPAVLTMGNQSVLLDAEAAELLVSYLQVIRAYFYSFRHSRKIITGLFEQVGLVLIETVQKSGNKVITNSNVSDLIQQLGCLDDWKHQYSHTTE